MPYLLAIPCIVVVCLVVDRLDLRRTTFVLFALMLTTLFVTNQWFTPGIDVVIASSLTLAVANFFAWFIDSFATEDQESQSEEGTQARIRRFCSHLTHDYAVSPKDSVFAIRLINNGEAEALYAKLGDMTPAERQGFYANLDYSSVSERALQEIINNNPGVADSHIIMGHVKLCLAKRLGLQPGATLDEPVSMAMAQAFKHFNSALRIAPGDPEALCGLLIAKCFTGLSNGHLYSSLTLLLQHEPRHLHGVVAAARFLVLSPSQANEFVSVVESAVDGRCNATVAIARITTHIECMNQNETATLSIAASNSQLVADLYQQLHCYQENKDNLGSWQKGIADNVIAYMLQLLGDKQELKRYLQKIEGGVSPYPWHCNTVS